jgi:hypothetical protein
VLVGYNLDEQQVHTHAVPIYPPEDNSPYYWMLIVAQTQYFTFSVMLVRHNSNAFTVSEVLFVVKYWNTK